MCFVWCQSRMSWRRHRSLDFLEYIATKNCSSVYLALAWLLPKHYRKYVCSLLFLFVRQPNTLNHATPPFFLCMRHVKNSRVTGSCERTEGTVSGHGARRSSACCCHFFIGLHAGRCAGQRARTRTVRHLFPATGPGDSSTIALLHSCTTPPTLWDLIVGFVATGYCYCVSVFSWLAPVYYEYIPH